MRFLALPFIALMGTLLCASSSSVWAFSPAQAYIEPQFLAPQLLLPPPEEHSPGWQKQIAAVLLAQRTISSSDMKALKDEQNLQPEMMASILGASFTRERMPKVFTLLDRVLKESHQIIEADKIFWHTRRPYLTDPRVKLYVDPVDDSPSYPSGHTASARVMAEVLGMLVPEKLPALRARADAIARHRIEAGVHYPVDVEGGRTLAMLIVGALATNDDFQDDLAAARKELASK